MMAGLTLAGAIHTALAMSGIAIGLFQFLRPKRGPLHRARGYAFVYAMLIADGAAMLVYQFTGQFNILHIGAIMNLICIVAAIIPVLRQPRPPNWKISALLLDVVVLCRIADGGRDRTRGANLSSGDPAAGLGRDRGDVGAGDLDRLCHHPSLPADFVIVGGRTRRNHRA